MVESHENVLDSTTLKILQHELQGLTYLKTGTNRPEVCLFGDDPYTYSRTTKDLTPLHLKESPVISKVLDIINSKFGGGLNSVLVNKYRGKNVVLGWHKDDENEVDNTYPIISLSIGTIRRFSISDSKDSDGRKHHYTTYLQNNGVFIMKAGVQNAFYHRVEQGRSSYSDECGTRFSLTFRHITPTLRPHPTIPVVDNSTEPQENHSASAHTKCYTTLVFGSSLTKGLQEDLLTQDGEKVKVFCHPGAWVNNVRDDIDKSLADKTVCTQCVKSIFLVVGGNQIENVRNIQHFEKFLHDYLDLLEHLKIVLPGVQINVISLIPRRARNYFHNSNMIRANDKLREICSNLEKCRFINIFSYYLVQKKEYFKNNIICLNDKLYFHDMLHFSPLGNSILGKVIKGVIFNPITVY